MSIWAAESKACNLQECKEKGFEDPNEIGDKDVFVMIAIALSKHFPLPSYAIVLYSTAILLEFHV